MLERSAKFYFVLCVLVQMTALTYSSLNGNLAGLVPWDDCVYLSRGIDNLEKVISARSVKDLLLIWPQLDIHAPVADLQSVLGMLLFQQTWAGVYFLNFFFVWMGLAVVDFFFRNYRPLIRIPIAIYFLLVPFVFVIFDLIKSDYKGGLFFFCCLLLLFRRNESRSNEGIESAAIGIFGCMAILSKITAFYFPAILITSVLLAALVRLFADGTIGFARHHYKPKVYIADSRGLRRELGFRSVTLGLIIVPPLIVWYFGYPKLMAYINYALSNVWDDRLKLSEHLLYYTPLNGLNQMWGSIFWISLAITLSAIIVSWMTRQLTDLVRIAALLVIVVLAAIPLLAVKTHNVSFGAYFYFALLATSFCAIDMLLAAVKEYWRITIAGALFFIGTTQPLALETSILSREEQRANYRAFALITEDIHETKGNVSGISGKGPRGAVLYECYLMCHFNLALLYYRNYGATLLLERFDDYEQKSQSLSAMLDRSDFVLTIDNNDAKGLQKRLFTASAHAKELDQQMLQDSRFALQRSVPVMNFNLHLFVRQ